MQLQLVQLLVLALVPVLAGSVLGSLSDPRAQLSATAAGRFTIFAGGYNATGADSDRVDLFDGSQNSWSVARLSSGRGLMAAASVSHDGANFALFAGGRHAKANRSDVVDIFNDKTGEWTVTHLSQARSMISAVSAAGLVYFAGGELYENSSAPSIAECSDVVDVWNVSSNYWSTMKLSQPRKKLASAATANLIIFAGGFLSGVGSVRTVDIWDTVTQSWSVAQLSTARFRHQGVSVGPLALFISGQGCDWTCASVDVYDSRTSKWSVTNISQGRYEFSAVVVGNSVVVAGGKQPRPRGLNPSVVEVFDLSSGLWRNSGAALSSPRYFLAGAVNNQLQMALFGGGSPLEQGESMLATVEAFKPATVDAAAAVRDPDTDYCPGYETLSVQQQWLAKQPAAGYEVCCPKTKDGDQYCPFNGGRNKCDKCEKSSCTIGGGSKSACLKCIGCKRVDKECDATCCGVCAEVHREDKRSLSSCMSNCGCDKYKKCSECNKCKKPWSKECMLCKSCACKK